MALQPVDGGFDDNAPPLKYSFWKGAVVLSGSATPRVIGNVLIWGVIALGIVLVSMAAERWLGLKLAISVGPFAAAGSVLGLLLVLRTNAGYDRWWESRKLWGGIVNQSRNMAAGGLVYGPKDQDWRSRYVRWVATFPHVVRRSLRGERTMPEVERLLGPGDAKRIATAEHMPGYVAEKMAELLLEGSEKGMHDAPFLHLEGQRSTLVDHLGGCERIRNTPLARSSAIQVRRFILMFLVSLPFGLLDKFPSSLDTTVAGLTISAQVWLLPLFVMLMAYPLLSLDRIGMELQNPFDVRRLDHLPLDRLCTMIEHNALELLVDDEPSEADEISGVVPMRPKPKSSRDTYIS